MMKWTGAQSARTMLRRHHDQGALRLMEHREERPSKTAHGPAARLRRLGRFILFLCTAGWMYPHVCTEDMDLTAIQKGHMKAQD
jgi:hypothetical protein